MNGKSSEKRTSDIGERLFDANECFHGHDDYARSHVSKSRPSGEYHSNSADLNAHMHGATPVPPKLKARPPRSSLQSLSCRTSLSSNMDNCNLNSNECVFT